MESKYTREHALGVLKKFYGYNNFRPGQGEVIETIMSGRDVVVIMPTGGGKSLCYQLPALISEGCALVISPLIALMDDQVAALQANGIPAAAIHSNYDETANREIVEAAMAGKLKLLYISPERVLADLDTWVSRLPLSLIAIDEAHCISQWGHDFRPVYTQLRQVRERCANVPVMALTATADRLTRDDISTQLGLNNPMRWIGSFNRPNLSLSVVHDAKKPERVTAIAQLIRKYPNDSGIVYTLSRKGAEDMAAALKARNFRVGVYHAGMSGADRRQTQQAFSNGELQAVCATVAFGMGIDKSNIRWVVHNNLPGDIESYYQEIGRGGRDGLPAETILFYSYNDVRTRESFNEDSGRPLVVGQKLEQMKNYAEATVCRRRILLSYFGEEADHDCGNCDVCLHPPNRFDGTITAQKALSAVLRTNEKIGAFTLAAILTGAFHSDIVKNGYHQIKTFGAGRDLPMQYWNAYIGQMIQLGVFELAYEEQNHLKVTPFGRKVLKGEVMLQLAEFVPFAAKATKKEKAQKQKVIDPETALFEQLKAVRQNISAKNQIPAYVVFSDATLREMAANRPQSHAELLQINGVGEVKAVKYGKLFLGAIRKFEGLSSAMPQGTTFKETLILHNAGFPLGDIARTKGVSTETILSHIARLTQEGMITSFTNYINRLQYEDIIRTLESGAEDAYDILKEKYTPGLITLAKAIAQKNNGG